MASKPGSRTPDPQSESFKRHVLKTVKTHRKGLVALGAVLLIVIVGVVFYVIQHGKALEESWATVLRLSHVIDPYRPISAPVPGEPTQFTARDREALEVEVENASSDTLPHVFYWLARARYQDRDYAGALEALDRLEDEVEDHPLNTLPSFEEEYSLLGAFRVTIEDEKRWAETHVFETPPVDAGRIALVETDQGSFWIGFFPEFSPKHVDNFIQRAKAGDFNGISVTEIDNSYVRFGGEASKDDDPLNDNEDEIIDPLASEKGRYRIPQKRGAVSSAALDEGESPTRFDILTAENAITLDKTQTVFGQVLLDRDPGMAPLNLISAAKTYYTEIEADPPPDPRFSDFPTHPLETIRVLRVSIWEGGKIADGHTWDTSEVVHPDALPADEGPTDGGASEETPGDGGDDEDK